MLPNPLVKRRFREPCEACGGDFFGYCPSCQGTGYSRIRCRSCFTWKSSEHFLHGGRIVGRCDDCRKSSPQPREPIRRDGRLLVKWNPRSRNRKTGAMPVSMSSPRTCPPGCPWMGNGCYAEQYFAGVHWRRLAAGRGMEWSAFCSRVAELPEGQLWRHNEAGDLPGDGDQVDADLLLALVGSNRGRRGFTYTRKPTGFGDNLRAIARANEGGFVVNLSADGLEGADRLASLGVGPVTTVVPVGSSPRMRTPAGRTVVVCPAVAGEGDCCLTCGLCARSDRELVVGFPAHGQLRSRMSRDLVQVELFG
jgi:hypothetical protein